MVKHSGEIVKEAMKQKKLTQMELARLIGRDQTLISRYMAGQIEISDAAARSMAEALDIDFDELRRQLQRDRFERRKKHLAAEFKEVITMAGKVDISASDEVANVAVLEEMISIPLLDSIPKNLNYKSRDKGKLYILPPDVDIDPENSFAVKVKENVITDDKVDQGDIIIVDTEPEVKTGDRALIIVDGKPILRKIQITGDTIFLQPSNSNELVIILSKGDDFTIIGRLAGCYKHF